MICDLLVTKEKKEKREEIPVLAFRWLVCKLVSQQLLW